MRDDDVRREPGRLLRGGGPGRKPGHAGSREPVGLTDRLREELGKPGPDRPDLAAHSVVGKLLEMALRGNPRAVQEVWNRVEGRPGDRPETPAATIDDATARKLLEFGLDEDDLPEG